MIKRYNELVKFLEKSEYSFDKNLIKKHCIDWREEFLGTSNLIIFPKSVTVFDIRAKNPSKISDKKINTMINIE